VGPELLGRLLDEHAAALMLFARQFCCCPEDAVQEAFVELVRQREMPREVLPWLYRVVRNKAYSASRAQGRRERREAAVAEARCAALVGTTCDGLDAETAAAALEQLPLEQREVVVAHLWGGLTFQQVGQLLGTSDSTAYRRYLAALDSLRKSLGIVERTI
jgi:RNA polymerase sigma-70 factor (ECF subfamily)